MSNLLIFILYRMCYKHEGGKKEHLTLQFYFMGQFCCLILNPWTSTERQQTLKSWVPPRASEKILNPSLFTVAIYWINAWKIETLQFNLWAMWSIKYLIMDEERPKGLDSWLRVWSLSLRILGCIHLWLTARWIMTYCSNCIKRTLI